MGVWWTKLGQSWVETGSKIRRCEAASCNLRNLRSVDTYVHSNFQPFIKQRVPAVYPSTRLRGPLLQVSRYTDEPERRTRGIMVGDRIMRGSRYAG